MSDADDAMSKEATMEKSNGVANDLVDTSWLTT